jgi:hypothetical protein
MAWTSALISVFAGNARNLAARPSPIEKSFCDSRLDHGADDTRASEPPKIAPPEPVQSSRYETGSDGPFWNGPRLRAAFAAQVLGQVFEARPEERRRAALTAYQAQNRAVRASVVDRA